MNYFWLCFFPALLLSTTINAHPGRTAGDGCHVCRTNCETWGEEKNKIHCHSEKNSNISKFHLNRNSTQFSSPKKLHYMSAKDIKEYLASIEKKTK